LRFGFYHAKRVKSTTVINRVDWIFLNDRRLKTGDRFVPVVALATTVLGLASKRPTGHARRVL
jgi:hypothetical protein